MSSHRCFGSRGQYIIPSARRSIHWYLEADKTSDMVGFRDDSSSDEQPSHEGVDEVDNVMSKLYRTSSPVFERKRHFVTPPSHHHQSVIDDSDYDGYGLGSTPTQSNHSKSNVSSQSKRSSSSRSFDHSRSSVSPKFNQSNNRKEDTSSTDGHIFKYLIVLVVAVFAAYYFNLMGDSQETNHDQYDELRFHNDLTELGAKYKVGDDSVLQLQAGISTIFKREDTSCFIFVYNSTSKSFNSNNFDAFVDNVASNAAKFLRNESPSVQHVAIEASDLTMGTHSRLVTAYRDAMAARGVLLVRGVERVPSPLAMAFHYYCDEFSPLVRKSAVFFTLDAAACRREEPRSSHASVENCLKEKWHTVPKDNIGPLLTRVVSIVVDVTGGFS